VSAFQRAGWDAWGCDRSLKAVEHGKQSGLQLCAADISEISLGGFDLITAFHVIEHIVHPLEFLMACYSHLRPGGFLLLEVPNYGSRQAGAMKESWPYLYPDTHLHQFEIGTLNRLLNQSGFQIVKINRVGGRGPLEERGQERAPTESSIAAGWHERAFNLRKLVYWIPGVRAVARHVLWQTLGFGEFIRVLACRVDTGNHAD
jgi:SAM-dependent methyltransferase